MVQYLPLGLLELNSKLWVTQSMTHRPYWVCFHLILMKTKQFWHEAQLERITHLSHFNLSDAASAACGTCCIRDVALVQWQGKR